MVYLVGAGPGDPGLVTMRARALLAAADVVAHDALVRPAILALARLGAELLPVGRRHGSGAASYRLHPAVIARAAAGQLVVRLKAGDPLIFGRGGEEAEELAEAGIPFEIVPGISAALGAAAYAGIPLTHRAHASDVTFASGHDVDGSHPTHTDWAQVARGTGTLVLFMAGKALAGNLARLVEGGRAPTTPAAYVIAATTPDQRVITGTLSTLAELVASAQAGQPAQLPELGSTAQARQLAQHADLGQSGGAADPATPDPSAHDNQRRRPGGVDDPAPGLVIIGDVVGLRHKLAWFAPGPLAGRRLLVGRARPGPSAIAAQLRALGAEVLEAPELEVAPLEDGSAARAGLEAALARLPSCAVVFGCAAGVDAVVAATTRGGHAIDRASVGPVIVSGESAARIDTVIAARPRDGVAPEHAVVCPIIAIGADSTAARARPGLALERVVLRPIIAIGEHAAAALARHGLAPTVVIRGACRDALTEHAAQLTAGPLLLVTGEAGRDHLRAELIALGATVDQVAVYRTAARMPEGLAAARFDAVVLASSSCARAVLAGPVGESLRDVPGAPDVPILAMGPYTEAAARDAGARTVICAARDDAAALVDAVVAHLRERPAGTRQIFEASETPETPAASTAQPARPRSLVVVYTGQGKGKTTAALGIVFRALGRGMHVAVVQFIKGKWKTGERLFAETLPGLTLPRDGQGLHLEQRRPRRAIARRRSPAWTTAKQLIAWGDHAIVVLDEITYAINYGFIELADVLAALRDRPPHVHVVIDRPQRARRAVRARRSGDRHDRGQAPVRARDQGAARDRLLMMRASSSPARERRRQDHRHRRPRARAAARGLARRACSSAAPTTSIRRITRARPVPRATTSTAG